LHDADWMIGADARTHAARLCACSNRGVKDPTNSCL
jgi:hypothetical protein